MSAADRKANLEALVVVDEGLAKCVDFTKHRFVSIERDPLTDSLYVKGHRTLRGACDHLASAAQRGESLVPVRVLDLDTGEPHELDVFVFVTPKSVPAVAVLLPAPAALALVDSAKGNAADMVALGHAVDILQRAILTHEVERRA